MRTKAIIVVLTLACGNAWAQSLFVQQSLTVGDAVPENAEQLTATSLFFVAPTQPRSYRVHDIVHVIINETSSATSSQSLETTKELSADNQIEGIIDPMKLLELQLEASSLTNLQLLAAEAANEYAGEGDYDRQDQLQARIAAEVVDVKPNGTLVLRARKTIATDEEERTITLTGLVRGEDITEQNTVLSSQLADLILNVENDGDVRNAAKKGVITRAFEWLFNF
ncbi:MAG: flagellar basal body L-ring protein FlgH [Planctomycetota bacterium]